MRISKVKKMVLAILSEDKMARNDDHYLYCKVIEKTEPRLLTAPFIETFNNHSIPRFESVRRARAKIQAQDYSLAADPDTEAARMVKEEEYRSFAKNG